MKIPRYLSGLMTGILLCLLTVACLYKFLYFPYPSNYYESPTIPFYVTEEDEGYSEYLRLNSDEYWKGLSSSAEDVAQDYCRQQGIDAKINISCEGSAQDYRIFYDLIGYVSLQDLRAARGLRAIIIDHVSSDYNDRLRSIN